MTSRERILAAMRGEPLDMIPISPRTDAYLIWKYGNNTMESHLAFQREFDQDLCRQVHSGLPNPVSINIDPSAYLPDVKYEAVWREGRGEVRILRRTFHTPAGKLTEELQVPPAGGAYGMSPNPTHTEFLIKERSDLEIFKYLLPAPEKHTDLDKFYETEAILGGRGITQLYLDSPFGHLAGDARGITNIMMDYYEDPELLEELTRIADGQVMGELKYCLEHGVKNIFGSWYYTSLSTGWSPALIRELFTPIMKKQAALCHSYGALYTIYDDGKLMDILADYIGTDADVIETLTPPPICDLNLRKAKEMAGNRVTLKGYIDLIYVMQRGTPKQVRDTVIEALEIAAPGGRFIIGSSDSFRENTPDENIIAYYKTAREYGAKFL